MIGKTVSHYTILGKLGEGGMGVVYKAQDLRLGRFVALKFLLEHPIPKEDSKQLEAEAKAVSTLNHKNVATIYDIENSGGRTFIAFEYLSGGTLKEKIGREGRLPLEETIRIAVQVAEGLHHAHAKKIIHRDIKPDNVMFSEDGTAKITDFGIAKLMTLASQSTLGSIAGTVSYMSPERITGARVDHRTDIWSLGVVMFEMLTGSLPFTGDVPQSLMYAILTEEPARISPAKGPGETEIGTVISKALQKDVSKRFQSSGEFAAHLTQTARHLGHVI